MAKIFKIKPVINKANGQINFSVPKRKMSKSLKKIIYSGSIIKMRFEGVDK